MFVSSDVFSPAFFFDLHYGSGTPWGWLWTAPLRKPSTLVPAETDGLAVVRPLAKGQAPTRTTRRNFVSWIPRDSSFPDFNHNPKGDNKCDDVLAIQSHQGTSITHPSRL